MLNGKINLHINLCDNFSTMNVYTYEQIVKSILSVLMLFNTWKSISNFLKENWVVLKRCLIRLSVHQDSRAKYNEYRIRENFPSTASNISRQHVEL